MKNLLFTLFLFLVPLGTFAYDFEVDGIYYNVTSDSTCEVTSSFHSSPYTGAVVIPTSVEYSDTVYSVTSIGNDAFWRCSSLTSLTIGNSVTSIGSYAFYYCSSLTSLTIPGSVTSIGAYAFWCCSNLTSLTIGNSVTSIGAYAFWGCPNMEAIYVDAGNLYFSSENGLLFNADKTTLVTVPAKISSVTIPNSVTSIGNEAFRGCSGLTSLTIPNSVTSIGSFAFYGCSGLTSLTIPGSVTSIGSFAFSDCSGLTSLTIPNSATSIGDFAFDGCTKLTNLECLAEVPPTCSSNTFFGVDTDSCELAVPESSIEAYKTADGWKYFYNIVTGIRGVTTDGGDALTRVLQGAVEVYDTAGRLVRTVEKAASIDEALQGLTGGTYILRGSGASCKVTTVLSR